MIFADTNVLVYSVDTSDSAKRAVAKQLLREALASKSLVLSTQVLQEYYVAVLRKRLLPPDAAAKALHLWARSEVVPMTPELVLRAVEVHQRYRLSFWDALIVQAAIEAGCTILYTEDLQHGQKIAGVEIVNPFQHGVHEEPAAYLHACTAVSVDKVLRTAIAQKRLVSLVYDGHAKDGEPHAYGVRLGKARLRFYQTAGKGRAGGEESGVWKTLDPARISNLRLLDRQFPGARASDGAKARWDELIASVAQGKD